MTDEQLIQRIRSMTDLDKVNKDRRTYQDTRDFWVNNCESTKRVLKEWSNISGPAWPDDLFEDINELASDLRRTEQKIKRIDPFIAALEEQARKLTNQNE